MIDYNKLSDREYLINQVDGIRTTNDLYILSNELKMLSQKIYDKKIAPDDAKVILAAIRDRQNELSGKRREQSNTDGGRKMTMTPTSTVVSNRVGSASIIFLLASVAATTVMYTLLALAHIVK